MYYNTTNQTGKILRLEHERIKTQGVLVLDYFEKHPCEVLSPSEVWDRLMTDKKIRHNTPLTSIRRTITDLTADNKLVKSSETKIGIYGKPEYLWFLQTGQGEIF